MEREESGGGVRPRSQWPGLVAAGIVPVLCLLPFLDKPFHIDAPFFVWVAQHLLDHPLDFFGFTANWFDIEQPLYEINQNPPGISYFIAAAGTILGWSERALHAAFLLPAAALGVACYLLGLRLTQRPLVAALAAVLTPAFLVSATNIMSDATMSALYAWAVVLWLRGVETRRAGWLFGAGVCIAAGAFTKYYAMSLVPLLGVYAAAKLRRPGWWLVALLVPVGAVALFEWYSHRLYGVGLLAYAAGFASKHQVKALNPPHMQALVGLVFVGGVMASVAAFVPVAWRWRGWLTALALFGALFAVLALTGALDNAYGQSRDRSLAYEAQAALWAAGGILLLLMALDDFRRARTAESLLLVLWVFGTFVFSAWVNWAPNARTMLPMAPAAGLLLARRIDAIDAGRQTARPFVRVAWPLVPAALLALAVAWCDYRWAVTQRTAAGEIVEALEPMRAPIRYQAHWGFQYYMEEQGFPPIDFNDPRLASRDLIIVPENNVAFRRLPVEQFRPVRSFAYEDCPWLSVMDYRVGAGFYGATAGTLPFFFGPAPPERYHVFVVPRQPAR